MNTCQGGRVFIGINESVCLLVGLTAHKLFNQLSKFSGKVANGTRKKTPGCDGNVGHVMLGEGGSRLWLGCDGNVGHVMIGEGRSQL